MKVFVQSYMEESWGNVIGITSRRKEKEEEYEIRKEELTEAIWNVR